MLKWSIGIGMMCLVSHAYSANIAVTTTDDVTVNDSLCSLREAIAYVNAGMPTAGLNGCGGENASAIIELVSEKNYNIGSRINITKSVQIKTVYATSVEIQRGTKNATIKMTGSDLIFNITDNSITENPLSVVLSELNLDGCAQATGCNNNGGLIFNQEKLVANYITFKNGVANLNGGAIYNAGTVTNDDKSSGYVDISNSIFENNSASQGAVIYSELPRFIISKSVIRNNTASNSADGTILYSAAKFTDASTSGNLSSRLYGLKNSTVFSNTGFVINVLDGMVLNNLTVLRNSKGLTFDAPLGNATLANSIVVENGRFNPNPTASVANCDFSATDISKSLNNLVNQTDSNDCGAGSSEANPNRSIENNKLIAGNSLTGTCDLPSADGLLCPFRTAKDTFLGFFKPRLLIGYNSIADSLIVNKGRVLSNGTALDTASCENDDQRGKSRSSLQLCDIGAIELVIEQATLPRIGQDILFGQIVNLTLEDNLADGDLLPAAQCAEVLGRATDRNGNPWQVGCFEIVQTNTPSKGALTLAEDGSIVYRPAFNWHGSDEFNLRVVTTLTRFSESEDKYLTVPVKIVQSPPNSFQDKTVNVGSGGGSVGWISLIGLLTLAGLRRKKK